MYTVSQSVDPDHFRVTAGTYVPSTLVVKVFCFFYFILVQKKEEINRNIDKDVCLKLKRKVYE